METIEQQVNKKCELNKNSALAQIEEAIKELAQNVNNLVDIVDSTKNNLIDPEPCTDEGRERKGSGSRLEQLKTDIEYIDERVNYAARKMTIVRELVE